MSHIKLHNTNHLFMHDTVSACIDTLGTEAKRGSTVFWKLDRCSGIKRIDTMYFKPGKTWENMPEIVIEHNRARLYIDPKAPLGDHYYAVEVILKNDSTLTIDPYIRIQD